MNWNVHETVLKLLIASDDRMSRPQALATQVARVVRIIGRKAFL